LTLVEYYQIYSLRNIAFDELKLNVLFVQYSN